MSDGIFDFRFAICDLTPVSRRKSRRDHDCSGIFDFEFAIYDLKKRGVLIANANLRLESRECRTGRAFPLNRKSQI
jgi:hypothetical protein